MRPQLTVPTGTAYTDKRGVARHLGVGVRTVSTYMTVGLPFYRLSGRRIRFKLDDVDGWMATRRVGTIGRGGA